MPGGFDNGYAAYPRAAEWLYLQLMTPAPITGVLGVYEDTAPEGATTAADVWIAFESLNPGEDVAEVGEQRIWTEFVFLVLATTRGRSTQALKAIADEIDKRLHKKAGTVDDGHVISSTRDRESKESWLQQGVEYRGLGGIYNLIVQPLDP